MRQINVHIEVSDSVLFSTSAVLNSDWIFDVLDAYFINRNMTFVHTSLDIGHSGDGLIHVQIPRITVVSGR